MISTHAPISPENKHSTFQYLFCKAFNTTPPSCRLSGNAPPHKVKLSKSENIGEESVPNGRQVAGGSLRDIYGSEATMAFLSRRGGGIETIEMAMGHFCF
jgi:hypothetical protein